jgi:hypothetical protein
MRDIEAQKPAQIRIEIDGHSTAPTAETDFAAPNRPRKARHPTARFGLRRSGRDWLLVKTHIDALQNGKHVMEQIGLQYGRATAIARRRCFPRCPFLEPDVQIGTWTL